MDWFIKRLNSPGSQEAKSNSWCAPQACHHQLIGKHSLQHVRAIVFQQTMNVIETNTNLGGSRLDSKWQTLVLLLLVAIFCGCGGPSTQDLLYKSARRKRTPEKTTTADTPPATPAKAPADPAQPSPETNCPDCPSDRECSARDVARNLLG